MREEKGSEVGASQGIGGRVSVGEVGGEPGNCGVKKEGERKGQNVNCRVSYPEATAPLDEVRCRGVGHRRPTRVG